MTMALPLPATLLEDGLPIEKVFQVEKRPLTFRDYFVWWMMFWCKFIFPFFLSGTFLTPFLRAFCGLPQGLLVNRLMVKEADIDKSHNPWWQKLLPEAFWKVAFSPLVLSTSINSVSVGIFGFMIGRKWARYGRFVKEIPFIFGYTI